MFGIPMFGIQAPTALIAGDIFFGLRYARVAIHPPEIQTNLNFLIFLQFGTT